MSGRWSLVAGLLLPLSLGCGLFPMESHVARAELYVAGDARYDQFFERVHAEQKAAQAWPQERKAARHALVQLFGFLEGADDTVLALAVRDRAKATQSSGYKLDLAGGGKVSPIALAKPDVELMRAVEEAARAELARGRKLSQRASDLDSLAKEADGLMPVVPTRFRPDGNAKIDEVKNELRAAHRALKDLSLTAKREERQGEDFLGALAKALLQSAQAHNVSAGTHATAPGPAPSSKPKVTVTDLPPPPKPPGKAEPLPPPKPPEPAKPLQDEFAP